MFTWERICISDMLNNILNQTIFIFSYEEAITMTDL